MQRPAGGELREDPRQGAGGPPKAVGALQGHGYHLQHGYARGRSAQVLQAGRDRRWPDPRGDEPVEFIRAGLSPDPEAGEDDRGSGGQ